MAISSGHPSKGLPLFSNASGSVGNFRYVPSHQPFLRTIADHILASLAQDDNQDLFGLSDGLVIVPSRRAVRAISEFLLANAPSKALLLPQIKAVSDISSADFMPLAAGDKAMLFSEIDAGQPKPISTHHRRFALANLVRVRNSAAEWSGDPASALAAADALANLIDAAENSLSDGQPFDWGRLERLDVGNRSAHWEKSLEFLKIATQFWPEYLAEQNMADRAFLRRQDNLATAQNMLAHICQRPIIALGLNDIDRHLAPLLGAIARLPRGAVVFSNLDVEMAESAWAAAATDPHHPQYILTQSLSFLGLERKQLTPLAQFHPNSETQEAIDLRAKILGFALTPKNHTDSWRDDLSVIGKEYSAEQIGASFEHVQIIEAYNDEEQALAIAHALVEEGPKQKKSVALITPDQALSRRVSAKLARFGFDVASSAGEPLAAHPLGLYLRLVGKFLADPSSPQYLIALLAHPFVKLGKARAEVETLAQRLDLGFLRGARRAYNLPDLMALVAAPAHRPLEAALVSDITQFLLALQQCHSTAMAAMGEPPDGDDALGFDGAVRALISAAEQLAADDMGGHDLWAGEAGEAASKELSEIIAHGGKLGPIAWESFERLLADQFEQVAVRATKTHPNIAILGPLDGRLLAFDVMILANLNEGIWPRRANEDPFLSDQMAANIGLRSHEADVGAAAHYFYSFSLSPKIIYAYGKRHGDSPAQESRWLWRIKTVVNGLAKEGAGLLRAHPILRAVRQYEANRAFTPQDSEPKARPPVSFRGKKAIAVTRIENWVRDPYAFYARDILGLYAAEYMADEPSSSERGNGWHSLAEEMADWDGKHLPIDVPTDLIFGHDGGHKLPSNLPQIAPDILARAKARLVHHLMGFGYSKPEALEEANWGTPSLALLLCVEASARAAKRHVFVEASVRANFDTPLGPITLTAKIDRLEVDSAGRAFILDHKSGTVPSIGEVTAFFKPQLTLTGLILRTQSQSFTAKNGAIITLAKADPKELSYLKIGAEPEVHHISMQLKSGNVKLPDKTISGVIDRAKSQFHQLTDRFARAEQAYLYKPAAKFRAEQKTYIDHFAHLARVSEWDDEEDGAAA